MRKIIIPFVALLAAFTACTRTDNKILNDLKKNGRVVLLSDLVDLTDPDRGEDTFTINETLKTLAEEGGGTLVFSGGTFKSRTIKLQSNITLYFDENAVLQAFPGEYSLEDLTDPATGELYDWATKQDAGHTWFCPSLFHGEDLEHVRIIGNGRIDGADVITKYDNLAQDQALVPMNNKTYKPVDSSGQVAMANNALPSPDSRGRTCNKMFALRRCTDVEIGGINPGKDLWYEGEISGKRGRIVYLNEDGSSDYESVGKMLHITDTGHFAILASGVDDLHIHDLYMDNAPNMRDAFNLMSCRDVVVCNIYIEGMSDDLIKFASDCSLGAPRSGGNFIVRNIVGNTTSDTLTLTTEVQGDDKFGSIIIKLEHLDSVSYIVQIVDTKDVVVRSLLSANERIVFDRLKPGDYKVQAFADIDNNGVWTPGNYWLHRQPEPIFRLDKTLSLRANWDIEETFLLE